MGAIALSLIGTGTDANSVIQSLPDGAFMVAFFGLPIAYAVEFAVGVPIYRALAVRGGVRPWHVILTATGVGLLVMPLIWASMWGPHFQWFPVLVGAAMGAASGGMFSMIALRKSAARPAI